MEIELHSMWPLGVDFFHSAEFPEAQSKSLCVCQHVLPFIAK